jgi:hypothetical protein
VLAAEYVPDVESPVSTSAFAPPCYDGWDLDEQLRHIQRVLAGSGATPNLRSTPGLSDSADSTVGQVLRFDPPVASPAKNHSPAMRRARPKKAGGRFWSVLTWIASVLGLLSFACGGGLMAWSVVSGRSDLWALGTPLALGGQVALLVGLVFQIDRLWQGSHATVAKLDDVDQHLHQLQTTTNMLGSTHGPSAAFYAHLAEGAGPHLLLNDLKGQLDLLAMKLSQHE